MRHFLWHLICLLALVHLGSTLGRSRSGRVDQDRSGKAFNLFNIVTFPNDPCTSSTDSTMTGTCLTNTECSGRGGTKNGNCASGFGVCCVFTVTCASGASVTRNCTYVQNEGYPTAAAAGTSCTYNVEASSSDICFVRLDFADFVLSQPSTAADSEGVCENDKFVAASPVSSAPNGASPPTVCGTLTGMHMYIDTGNSGTSAATLTLTHGSSGSGGTHKIKVSFIECSNPGRPPSNGCTQYYTGTSGTLTSYNFAQGQVLAGQRVSMCIRQEEGFCSFTLRETTGITTPDPFFLSNGGNAAALTMAEFSTENGLCDDSAAHIMVSNRHDEAATTIATSLSGDVRCGAAFTGYTVMGSSENPGVLESARVTPFVVYYNTPYFYATGTGYSLDYAQVAC